MYQALYRKWRPMSFDDVVSQPHITTTLKNQIKSGKTAHAYLFTGSRGTGKTTCARIFAKAINCLDPHDGEPCLECEICKDADNGTLSDIIEIDAASNSKVDDIRELREGGVLPRQCAQARVYHRRGAYAQHLGIQRPAENYGRTSSACQVYSCHYGDT